MGNLIKDWARKNWLWIICALGLLIAGVLLGRKVAELIAGAVLGGGVIKHLESSQKRRDTEAQKLEQRYQDLAGEAQKTDQMYEDYKRRRNR